MEQESATRPARGASFVALLALAGLVGCGRAGGSADAVPARLTSASADSVANPTIDPRSLALSTDADSAAARIESLRKRGRFEEFINAALNATDEQADDPAVQLLKVEALLGQGDARAADAAALAAATVALEKGDSQSAAQALKLWVMSRFRLGVPLASNAADELVAQLPADNAGAQLVRFWMEELSERAPYSPGDVDAAMPVEVPPTRAAAGTIWADLNAIEARAGGVSMPMVFIDTGAQHTLMTRRAAEKSGVRVGQSATQLVGFAGVVARPAVLETLELGDLTLHDVPVLVGDSPPLLAANGQMALGTELMHHVRFTLDYPARLVFAERADRPPAFLEREPSWDIPIWTFSQACVARAEGAHGEAARVLVDTGNRRGTYVSARWARRNLSQFERPTSSLVFKFRHEGLSLDTMDLGNSTLHDWPVWDRIPGELEKLDLVDLLVGRDLLWPYRLSIDLRQRVMRLHGGPQMPVPPPDELP